MDLDIGPVDAKILVLIMAGICACAGAAVIHFKGEEPSPLPQPMIENSGAHDIAAISATLWADYDVGPRSAKIRFGYRKNSSDTWQYTNWSDVLGSGRLSKLISGLDPDTCYEFRTFLQYDSDALPGPVKIFETQLISPTIKNFEATDIGETSAVLNTSYNCGSYPETNIQFSYKGIGREVKTTEWRTVSGSGALSENVSNLTPGMVYQAQTVIQYDNTLYRDNTEVFQTPQLPGQPSVPNYETIGTVTSVADGDTIFVLLTWVDEYALGVDVGRSEAVRFAGGIDAPELTTEEGGPEAKNFMVNLCPPGTEVLLDLDDQATYGLGYYRDFYGRLLGVIYIRKNNTWVNINAELLRWGMEAYPNNRWDEYAHFTSEFSMYEWPPYDNDYPYVL